MTINDTKAIPENLLLYVNIINFKNILLIFQILRRGRINEVRLQNLSTAHCKHILFILVIIKDNTFFRCRVWNHK